MGAGIIAAVVLLAAIVFGIGHESQFVFKPEDMHRIAKSAIQENAKASDPQVRNSAGWGGQGYRRAGSKLMRDCTQAIVDSVVKKLHEEFPDHVVKDPEWLFNNAGGAMGAMLVCLAALF